jgi:hypothetical protein
LSVYFCLFVHAAAIITTTAALRSVENAIAASFTINGVDLAWGLWGEFEAINSHAKFGVAASDRLDEAWVVGGDENNQGFSCSTKCSGSQNGRGGLFFGVKSPKLHKGLYDTLKIVCACNALTAPQKRFCYFGCAHKVLLDCCCCCCCLLLLLLVPCIFVCIKARKGFIGTVGYCVFVHVHKFMRRECLVRRPTEKSDFA